MEVVDVTGTADRALLDEITSAVADFEEWTGRTGVCVPDVHVVDTVGEGLGGRFQELKEPILIARQASDPYRFTVHELCHALDAVEGHSDSELFPPVPADENYVTLWQRKSEAFADACENGPIDLGVKAYLEDTCGITFVDAVERYVREEVYVEATYTVPSAEPAAASLERGWLGLAGGSYVYDAALIEGRSWVLVDWYVAEEDVTTIGLAEVDPASGEVGAPLRFPIGQLLHGGILARADSGITAIVGDADSGTFVAIEVDPETSEATRLDLDLPGFIDAAARSDGTLYTAHDACGEEGCTASITAWNLDTLAPVSVPSPGERVWSLHPVPGGIEAYTEAGLVRYDGSGWEIVASLPEGMGPYGWLSERERLFVVRAGDGAYIPVVLDIGTQSWRMLESGCGDLGLTNPLIAAGEGSAWVLGNPYDADGAPIPAVRITSG
jgi:hypothetical protein